MNIILKDGRKELYQWDTGRQIQFDDSAVGQAHFANKLFSRSMDVDIVDGVCTIPDELLQTGRPLHKQFRITVDDTGTLSATEVTDA